MKKYYVHEDYLLDKEDVESIRDSFDDFRIMILADEVDAEIAQLQKSLKAAKDLLEIQGETIKKCSYHEEQKEIARLIKRLLVK